MAKGRKSGVETTRRETRNYGGDDVTAVRITAVQAVTTVATVHSGQSRHCISYGGAFSATFAVRNRLITVVYAGG